MTKRQTIALYERLNRCNRRARRNAARVLAWLEEYPMRIVVADNQVEWFRKAYGDAAVIIPLSETYLPVKPGAEQ